MTRWFVALAALRAVSLVAYDGRWAAGLLLLAACVVAWRSRRGFLVLAAVAFGLSATLAPSNSVTLIGWVAAAVGLFNGRDLHTVLRVQATVVYLFAAINKLSVAFLSGQVLAAHAPWLPWPRLAAVAVIYAEALLAVAVWRRWPVALPLAVAAHVTFTFGVADSLWHVVALSAFNGTMVLLVWWSRSVAETADREPCVRRASGESGGAGVDARADF